MNKTPLAELEHLLSKRIAGEARFDPYTRIMYSTDGSFHQIMPMGVVFPRTADDLCAIVETAAEAGVPVLPRGAGTGLAGQTLGAALIVDCGRHLTLIHRLDPEAQEAEVDPGVVCSHLNQAAARHGLMFGPDGLLYGCQGGANRLVSFSTNGEQKTVAEVSGCNDLVVTAAGNIYYTDPANHQVWLVPKGGQPKVVHEGADRADRAARGTVRPNGVAVSPDQSLLFVADSWSKWTWSFQIQPDGSLANEQAFYRLEATDASSATSADGLTVAADGHVYIATAVGLQVCDQPGRVVGIINKPQAGALSNAVFAGSDLKTLYVTAGDKVFRRRMRVAGFHPWKVVKPPRPRL